MKTLFRHFNITSLNYCLLFLLIIWAPGPSMAQPPEQVFDQANAFYQKNEMQKAAQLYEGLIKGGHESASLYFNLGNAYYKLNNNALAILNYERAKKLNPHDDDIAFNLKMANLKVTDKVEAMPVLFYEHWWNNIVESYSFDQWAVLGTALIWIVFVLVLWFVLTASRLVKQLTFYAALLFFLMSAFAFVLADTQNKQFEFRNEAIVFVPSVYIKSSPTDKSTDLFILHEGSKVQILDKVGPWEKIKLLNGNVGWVKETAVAVI
jgi:tetratricopeptide (TPR) repeat protein